MTTIPLQCKMIFSFKVWQPDGASWSACPACWLIYKAASDKVFLYMAFSKVCTYRWVQHVILQFRCPGSYRNELPWGGEGVNLPCQTSIVACLETLHSLPFRHSKLPRGLKLVCLYFSIHFLLGSCSLPLGVQDCQHLEVISGVGCDLHPSKTNFSG